MKLYRFETLNFNNVTVICSEYEVVKETPAGYWIEDWSVKKSKRWVSKTGFKRFAYVDKVDAAASYLARSRRYIEILLARQRVTEEAVAWFEKNREELIKGKPLKLLNFWQAIEQTTQGANNEGPQLGQTTRKTKGIVR